MKCMAYKIMNIPPSSAKQIILSEFSKIDFLIDHFHCLVVCFHLSVSFSCSSVSCVRWESERDDMQVRAFSLSNRRTHTHRKRCKYGLSQNSEWSIHLRLNRSNEHTQAQIEWATHFIIIHSVDKCNVNGGKLNGNFVAHFH